MPAAGRYRLRFSGYTIWVSGGGIGRWFYEGQGDQKAPVYHLPHLVDCEKFRPLDGAEVVRRALFPNSLVVGTIAQN